MFETMPPDLGVLAAADDGTVVAAIEELVSRRCDKEEGRASDGWGLGGADVACALGLRHNKASSQMSVRLTLRHRLPKAAGLYAERMVSYRVISPPVHQFGHRGRAEEE